MPVSTLLLNTVLEVPATSSRQGENERNINWKGRRKTVPFTDDTALYKEYVFFTATVAESVSRFQCLLKTHVSQLVPTLSTLPKAAKHHAWPWAPGQPAGSPFPPMCPQRLTQVVSPHESLSSASTCLQLHTTTAVLTDFPRCVTGLPHSSQSELFISTL